jgi:hypothetical protein
LKDKKVARFNDMSAFRNGFCLIIVLIAFNVSFAQITDLAGTWKGWLGQDDKEWGFDMFVELRQANNIIYGTSKIVAREGSGAFAIHNIEGKIYGNEVHLIDLTINQESIGTSYFSWCKRVYVGKIEMIGDSTFITGTWRNDGSKIFIKKQVVDNSLSYCYPGIFKIKKEREIKESIIKNDDLFLAAPVAGGGLTSWNVLSREVTIKENIKVNSDSVKLLFFDNGEVDNDTISVYYNKKLIVDHKRLSTKAIEVVVTLQANTDNEIVMFAENEGTTPPNTALMVFYDKGVRREVTIDSSTKKSESVILKKN